MRSKEMKPLIAILAISGISACSSISKRQVELRSIPSGAQVYSLNGESLGPTPLVLSGDMLAKATPSNRLNVVMSANGHLPRELVLEIRGEDSHEVRLTKADKASFSRYLLNDFSPQANEMSRELLRIQGLVLTKQLDEAEKALSEFQKNYSNIAASYVLWANIEILRGKRNSARAYLLRARSIDPDDEVVGRMLKNRELTNE